MSQGFVDRLAAEARAAPLKAGLLGLGVLVACVVWVPRLMASRAAPAPETIVADVATDAAQRGFALGDRDSLAIRGEFAAIVEEAKRLRAFAAPVPKPERERDPFALPVPTLPQAVVEAPAPPPPPPPPPPAPSAVENAIASRLTLGGVMQFGSRSRAVIDGALYGVGDLVAGLEIEAIGGREVHLAGRHGRYTLRMRDPRDAGGGGAPAPATASAATAEEDPR
jgi:hypothetical protein